jgi:hypothetical protein
LGLNLFLLEWRLIFVAMYPPVKFELFLLISISFFEFNPHDLDLLPKIKFLQN